MTSKHKAIPNGFMTVGEVAKKMETTVRTLQYYDKEELLTPSAESEGGRRLYSDKDLIKLHQILSLKSLGFSLDDIRKRLIPLENPLDVAKALSAQADEIRSKIASLSGALDDIEKLRLEVLEIKTVDFKKYADIIVNLQLKNEYYYLIKRFDDKTLDYLRERFDKKSGLEFMERFNSLSDKIIALQNASVPPENEKSQQLAKEFWDLIIEFTNGDMEILPKLIEIGNFNGENEWEQKQSKVNAYLSRRWIFIFQN